MPVDRRRYLAILLVMSLTALALAGYVPLNVHGGPSITLSPTSGLPGTTITFSGTSFSGSDSYCAVAGTPILAGSQACVVTPAGSGIVSGSFIIGKVSPGQYVITVGGNSGDFAQAVLMVTGTVVVSSSTLTIIPPTLTLSPTSGLPGITITFTGSGFSSVDSSCAVAGPPVLSGTQACVITLGSGVVSGSFIIANVAPGNYVITVGGNQGDFAQAVLTVAGGAAALTLIPTSGPSGTEVVFFGTLNDNPSTCVVAGYTTVSYAVTSATATSAAMVLGGACVIGSTITSSDTCGPTTLTVTTTTIGKTSFCGSFEVGPVSPGQYVIRVTGSDVSTNIVEAIFDVTSGPNIQLNGVFPPAIAQVAVGSHVKVTGSGFLSDNTCAIGAPGSAAVLGGTQACVITPSGSGLVVGSFTVGRVLPGQYVIQVTGGPAGDFAQAIINVTTGPTLTLIPSTAPPGATITFTGSGFLPTDISCAVGAPGTGVILGGTQACTINLGSGKVTGSFTVNNVLPGQYVIQVTGSSGDFAQTILTVASGPTITLSPLNGVPGATIIFTGSGFLPTDNTCAVGAPGTAAILGGTQACNINVGTGDVTGSFTIGNVLPGQYIIQVTGNGGDFARAILTVSSGPRIQLTPTAGETGTHVAFTGTGFLPTDNTCAVGAPGSAAVIGGTQACTINVGTGDVTGSFTIGNVLPGQYVIQVTGTGGDFAQAVFNVTTGPAVSLTPTSGLPGATINFNGFSFLPTDTVCAVTGTAVLSGSQACVIRAGTGIVTGSFIISNVRPGEYVINVGGNQGDFAQAVLLVLSVGTGLVLQPTNATNGATVTFRGTGLSATDTSCVVQSGSYADHVFTPNTILITSPTCSILTPGVATGSFVVGPYATEDINWTVQVMGTPVDDLTPGAVFNVTASITVTPTSGTVNTVFTYTGSGFESTATSCTATVVPAIGVVPGCAFGATTGQVSGSVVVPATAHAGTYGIVVVDNTGSSATGTFTVGTPSALVQLNPASVEQGQPVGVAGTGFNPQDMFCVIDVGGVPTIGTPTCLISSGYASGSFTVSQTATGGYYLITIQACAVAPVSNVCPPGDGLDFASNFLGVTLQSTVTTFTPTTTTSTTTTSLSTTTTTVATSFSYSSTTEQTTGILFTTYSQLTVTTVSGLTTTSVTSTSSTTQTQTTVTVSTTTSITTVPCGPLPCGYVIQPQSMNPSPVIDSTGLLAALLLLIPMLLRRLFG